MRTAGILIPFPVPIARITFDPQTQLLRLYVPRRWPDTGEGVSNQARAVETSRRSFMKIDIQRLDERIKKLQEARRIAADPELVSILLDFVSTDAPGAAPVLTPKVDSAFGPRTDRTDELIQNVVKGTTPEQGNSIWPTNVRAAVTK